MGITGEQDADSRNFERSNAEDISTNFKEFCKLQPPGQTGKTGMGTGMGVGVGVRNGGHEAEVCCGRPIGSTLAAVVLRHEAFLMLVWDLFARECFGVSGYFHGLRRFLF